MPLVRSLDEIARDRRAQGSGPAPVPRRPPRAALPARGDGGSSSVSPEGRPNRSLNRSRKRWTAATSWLPGPGGASWKFTAERPVRPLLHGPDLFPQPIRRHAPIQRDSRTRPRSRPPRPARGSSTPPPSGPGSRGSGRRAGRTTGSKETRRRATRTSWSKSLRIQHRGTLRYTFEPGTAEGAQVSSFSQTTPSKPIDGAGAHLPGSTPVSTADRGRIGHGTRSASCDYKVYSLRYPLQHGALEVAGLWDRQDLRVVGGLPPPLPHPQHPRGVPGRGAQGVFEKLPREVV